MDRVILHSDCNSFYASVECLLRPELRDIPMSVGGSSERRHGIILASNIHAKKYGVRTGEPLWQARQKCPALTIVEPSHGVYQQFSQAAREIYLEYSDYVEPFGPDEAWIDVSSIARGHEEGLKIAQEINARIRRELGITVSVGVSWNKIFAKLGSDYKKPDAITGISRENYRDIAYPLPIGCLLFVGESSSERLQRAGIRTIGDAARAGREYLTRTYGKYGGTLYDYASGNDASPVARYGEEREVKSVSHSTTTCRDITGREDASVVLCSLAERVSQRLRRLSLCGQVVTLSVRDVDLGCFTRQRNIGHPTSCGREIAQQAYGLLEENYAWQKPLRSLGVCVSDLAPRGSSSQLSLFAERQQFERREQLEQTADGIKERFGRYAVYPARLLTDCALSGVKASSLK